MSLYTYGVFEIVKVVDGDTYDLIIDAGFHLSYAARVRLNAWDTPEVRYGSDYEKQMGREATDYVERWFERIDTEQLRVHTHKDDSFGRWLADVFTVNEDGDVVDDLGEMLGEHRLATPWPTRWRETYDVNA